MDNQRDLDSEKAEFQRALSRLPIAIQRYLRGKFKETPTDD